MCELKHVFRDDTFNISANGSGIFTWCYICSFWFQMLPLWATYMRGHMGLVDLLLRQPGVDINMKDDQGECMTCFPSLYKDNEMTHTYLPITEIPGLILGLCPANVRCCYKVTPSLIGWEQT